MKRLFLLFRIAICATTISMIHTPTLFASWRCCGDADDVVSQTNFSTITAPTSAANAAQETAANTDEREFRPKVKAKLALLALEVKIIHLLRKHQVSMFFEDTNDKDYKNYATAKVIVEFLCTNITPSIDTWKTCGVSKNVPDWQSLFRIIDAIETSLRVPISLMPEVAPMLASDKSLDDILKKLEAKYPANANATAAAHHSHIVKKYASLYSTAAPSTATASTATSQMISRYTRTFGSLPTSANSTPFTGSRILPPLPSTTAATAATPAITSSSASSQQTKQLNS